MSLRLGRNDKNVLTNCGEIGSAEALLSRVRLQSGETRSRAAGSSGSGTSVVDNAVGCVGFFHFDQTFLGERMSYVKCALGVVGALGLLAATQQAQAMTLQDLITGG